jgi:hypothetical protein
VTGWPRAVSTASWRVRGSDCSRTTTSRTCSWPRRRAARRSRLGW